MNSDSVVGLSATVQVWGKGFRVSIDSEEFQLLVPQTLDAANVSERVLSRIHWGAILEPLYGLSERELGLQRAVLIHEQDVVAIAFARSEDRHGRPSMVMTAAVTSIDWSDGRLARIVSRTVMLSMRLAREYAGIFVGNGKTVASQLSVGSFLRDRRFDLENEQEDIGTDWERILAAVRRFRGVEGVATSRLMKCGANILLGTRHETERMRQEGIAVDGFYDVRSRTIVPLTSILSPWEPTPQEDVRGDVSPAPFNPDAASDAQRVLESLERIERSVQLIADAVLRLLHLKASRRKK